MPGVAIVSVSVSTSVRCPPSRSASVVHPARLLSPRYAELTRAASAGASDGVARRVLMPLMDSLIVDSSGVAPARTWAGVVVPRTAYEGPRPMDTSRAALVNIRRLALEQVSCIVAHHPSGERVNYLRAGLGALVGHDVRIAGARVRVPGRLPSGCQLCSGTGGFIASWIRFSRPAPSSWTPAPTSGSIPSTRRSASVRAGASSPWSLPSTT